MHYFCALIPVRKFSQETMNLKKLSFYYQTIRRGNDTTRKYAQFSHGRVKQIPDVPNSSKRKDNDPATLATSSFPFMDKLKLK